MEEDHVAALTVLTNTRKGVFNVTPGRGITFIIVHENEHIALVKALVLDEILFNVAHVIVTA
jgi:hypothetical protein